MVKYTIYNVFSVTHNNLKASWIECNRIFFSTKTQLKSSLQCFKYFHSSPSLQRVLRSIKSRFCWNHFILCFLVQCFDHVWLYSSIGVEKLPSNLEKNFLSKPGRRNLLFQFRKKFLQNRVVCMSCVLFSVLTQDCLIYHSTKYDFMFVSFPFSLWYEFRWTQNVFFALSFVAPFSL